MDSAILVALIGSAGVFSLLQFLITRFDKKKDDIGALKRMAKQSAEDNCRIQLLFMTTSLPHEHQEIMTVARRYFIELGGNWYMDSLFNAWLDKEGLEPPSWFTKKQ